MTDVLFCIFFLVFLLGLLACSGYGYFYGNPKLLLVGWDSDRHGCGYSNATLEYPYLYFPMSPSTEQVEMIQAGNYTGVLNLLNSGVCVSQCPSANQIEKVNCMPTTLIQSDYHFKDCVYYPGAMQTNLGLIYGSPFRYNTTTLLDHFCMPNGSDYINS